MFSPYLCASQKIEIPSSTSEIDKIFWDAASPGAATEGIIKQRGLLVWKYETKALTMDKPSTGARHRKNMPNTGIYIRKNFMKN